MLKVEKALHLHFAQMEDEASQSSLSAKSVSQAGTLSCNSGTLEEQVGPAFAKVNSVVTGSPADQAGLRAGDKICLFGGVNWLNHEKLSRVAQEVQNYRGVCTLLNPLGSSSNDCT